MPTVVGSETMSTEAPLQRSCHVLSSEKLPSGSDSDAICAAVERAMADLAPNVRYAAEIRVVTRSRLAATLIVNGHSLPEQKFAVMDHQLDRGSIERFAKSLADQVARATKP